MWYTPQTTTIVDAGLGDLPSSLRWAWPAPLWLGVADAPLR